MNIFLFLLNETSEKKINIHINASKESKLNALVKKLRANTKKELGLQYS